MALLGALLCSASVAVQANSGELEEQLRSIEQSLPEGCEILDIRDTIRKRFTGSRLTAKDVEALQGMTIRGIGFLQVGVFDEDNPDENNSLYRFLNKIHVNTKEYVVAPQLLFKEGDTLDTGVILETERLLRTRRSEEHTSELQSRPHLVC